MVRALRSFSLIGLVLWEAFAHAKPDGRCPIFFAKLKPVEREAARDALEKQRLAFLANPPTVSIRVFKPEEITIAPMNGGRAFEHEYIDAMNVRYYEGAKLSIGNIVTFKGSLGQTHKIEIIGSNMKPELLEQMTNFLTKMPADVLEATKKIELQGFVKNSGDNGYALNSEFVLHQGGLTERTFRHEFGHNLAYHIWGNTKPFDEWQRVFDLDGRTFTTPYAASKYSETKLAEDFAEAVDLYISNTEKFRASFPNRAALLDTMLRNSTNASNSPFAPGGLWRPLRDDYHARRPLLSRVNEAHPSFVVYAVAGGASAFATGTSLYYMKFKFDETPSTSTSTPRPTPTENPH